MRFRLLDLLAFLRLAMEHIPLKRLMDLWPFPKWTDAEEVRHWALRVLAIADEFAIKTTTQIDDFLVNTVRKIAASREAWVAVYGLIVDLADGNDAALVAEPDNERIKLVSDKAGIDPVSLIMLIQAAIQLIQWWRNRNRAEPVTENID